ncbi:bone morphogenetic protein 1-like [Ptychodera flava]|uniref:bone morphogenetic protein 1-like n=1 Tax=Ptychodera flava TaxID=63121 RepID=UPI003969D5AF
MMYIAAYTHRNQLEYVLGYPVQTYKVASPPYQIPEPMKCGGEYSVKNDSFLQIISPNYPDRYDNLESCESFVSASLGKVIAVHIHDFSTEPWFDYLDIGEGSNNSDSSSRIHHLSGIIEPWEYWNLQTNELWLTFITDGFIRLRGFMIELEEINEGQEGYEKHWVGNQERCYKFVSDPKPWDEGREDCLATENGDLVIINDQVEVDYVSGGMNTNKYWIADTTTPQPPLMTTPGPPLTTPVYPTTPTLICGGHYLLSSVGVIQVESPNYCCVSGLLKP